VAPTANGRVETILHNFKDSVNDGYLPYASVIFDNAGNLYGTTRSGGAYSCGTVFEVSPNGEGGWTEKVLHNFRNRNDGCNPLLGLVFDTSGNLYGTTSVGGLRGTEGTVFELSPKTGGGWTEKTLHRFNSRIGDGAGASSNLIFDSAGNLYGATSGGGDYGYGVVFELSPEAGGEWTENILANFAEYGEYGNSPGGLIIDAAGNLYGFAGEGGSGKCLELGQNIGCGVVFELVQSDGWSEEVLHTFENNGTDGVYPYGNLVFDTTGNLYGTTVYGGSGTCTQEEPGGCGTVFKLTAQDGGWTETILYAFKNNGRDGYSPYGLTFGAAGDLYGTTRWGGVPDTGCEGVGCGVIFELAP
jgi:uncharacterized repeat protein (TIGR03803 family)